MGGKGSPKIQVVQYHASVHLGICTGVVDSINKLFFNDKQAWGRGYKPDGSIDRPKTYQLGDAWDNDYEPLTGGTIGDPNDGDMYTDRIAWKTQKSMWLDTNYNGGTLTWRNVVSKQGGREVYGPQITRRVLKFSMKYVEGSENEFQSGGQYDTIIHFDPADGKTDYPIKGTPEGDILHPVPSLPVGSATQLVLKPRDPDPPSNNDIVTEQSTVFINAPNLFGGLKKEGGVKGYCHMMMGTLDQTVPANLAQKLGRTPETMPAYRGVANIWFYGSPSFYFIANTNRLPDVSVEVTRIPKVLNPDYARIGNDVNPAHIIFEAMSDTDWGMGAPITSFDVASFNAAAAALYDEEFGMSMMWSDQMEIEKFVSEVIDHIEATLFVHPRTGLFTLKLIRADYDADSLRTITPDNAKLSNFQRKGWGETINEIVVTYTNPENEGDLSFTIQDTANIAMQGAIITDNRDYYGIRKADLAARVAERDLRAASAPLCSCEVELRRDLWDIVPGDVVKLDWPEYGLAGIVMRVGPVDYGKPGDPRIRTTLVEDVFFLPNNAYFIPPETEWEDPRENAQPIPLTKIITLPFYYVMRLLGITDEESDQLPQYPETIGAVLGSTYQLDAHDYDLQTPQADTVGNVEYASVGANDLAGYAVLSDSLIREETSNTFFTQYTPKGLPTIGGFVLIGDGTDRETEMCLLVDYDDILGWTLRRGVLDTVPQAWPVGTAVRFIDADMDVADETVRADGSDVDYKLLTRTSINTLPLDDAPVVSGELNGRPHYPFRPANVRVNNILWGPQVIDNTDPVNMSWSTRSRLQETSVIMKWTEASVPPEVGQTVNVTFFDDEDTVIEAHTGLTATTLTQAIDFANIPGPLIKYQIESERDGLKSLQPVEAAIEVCGYGMNYGNYYGGKPA